MKQDVITGKKFTEAAAETGSVEVFLTAAAAFVCAVKGHNPV